MSIRACDLCKTIRSKKLLDHVSFEVTSGATLGLCGVNGSGKTVLMRAIAGLIRPTSGWVEIDGKRLGRDIRYPPNMGLLIEAPALIEGRSAMDNLVLLASIRGMATREDIAKALVAVGLDPLNRQHVRTYSLGMRQRLGIAIAVMELPDLVLLDEPTNALDRSGVEMVANVIRAQHSRGATVVVSSHDQELLDDVSDVTVQMNEGRATVQSGDTNANYRHSDEERTSRKGL